ncbi:NAD-dependent epimerase/dehydratase family protein [Shimia sediminis]|uniref:NAD-dependent epimerase/dehydratase family protein n=1 Tax=Shimia sediminis TaxID=2497945 RepID=UPI0013DEEB1C|nr:NAD-dependent epimerase/dehydratase family protein [Shimia sediminis]
MNKVVLTGETGMIGSAALRALNAEPRMAEITSISRGSGGVCDENRDIRDLCVG